MASSGYFNTLSDFFSSSYDTFTNSSFYQQFGRVKDGALHGAQKLKDAEFSGIAYKAFPVALGGYLGFSGLKTLSAAVFGYDSRAIKKEFLKRAYNNSELSYNERISLCSRGVFGSMKGQTRAKLLAESIIKFLLSAALIVPLFAKNNAETTPDLEQTRIYNHQLKQQENAAIISGTSRTFNLHTWKDTYNEQGGRFGQVWERSLNQPQIDENTQQFATKVLDAPTGQPTILEGFKGSLKNACDWTVGLTRWGSHCETLTPNTPKPLFNTMANGAVFIDEEVLGRSCNDTLSFIQNDPEALSFSAQQKGNLDSLSESLLGCSKLRSSPGTNLNPTYKDIMTTACRKTPTYPLGWAEKWACKKLHSLSNNSWLFNNPKQERQDLTSFVNRVCTSLKSRSQTNQLLAPNQPFALSTTDKEAKIPELLAMSKAFSKLNTPTSGGQPSLLQGILETNPAMAGPFTRNFLNISSDTPLTDSTIHKAYKDLSLAYHSDKCSAELKESCSTIFMAAKELSKLTKGHNLEGTANNFYSIPELAGQIFNYFQSN